MALFGGWGRFWKLIRFNIFSMMCDNSSDRSVCPDHCFGEALFYYFQPYFRSTPKRKQVGVVQNYDCRAFPISEEYIKLLESFSKNTPQENTGYGQTCSSPFYYYSNRHLKLNRLWLTHGKRMNFERLLYCWFLPKRFLGYVTEYTIS